VARRSVSVGSGPDGDDGGAPSLPVRGGLPVDAEDRRGSEGSDVAEVADEGLVSAVSVTAEVPVSSESPVTGSRLAKNVR
jgi:hypothetical protein